jgi:hypothetical protein
MFTDMEDFETSVERILTVSRPEYAPCLEAIVESGEDGSPFKVEASLSMEGGKRSRIFVISYVCPKKYSELEGYHYKLVWYDYDDKDRDFCLTVGSLNTLCVLVKKLASLHMSNDILKINDLDCLEALKAVDRLVDKEIRVRRSLKGLIDSNKRGKKNG